MCPGENVPSQHFILGLPVEIAQTHFAGHHFTTLEGSAGANEFAGN